ncbi:hypothetical protein [Aureimonas ureilytica]|uniref:hypothetical protein n=1 Tax=Aureimonas ureilytica TaxID=401562 RepID=UPI00036116FF|nr:hypothetical protein [Aureimonas ureilytica]
MRIGRLAATLLLCVLPASTALASAALAQEWRGLGSGGPVRAAFTLKGKPAGVEFQCEAPGRVRTVVAGSGARVPDGRAATLVFSVDGVAEMLPAKAEAEPHGTGSRFARSDALSDLKPLFDRLRRGRELELSGPAGAFRLPLKGSGKALGLLVERCG